MKIWRSEGWQQAVILLMLALASVSLFAGARLPDPLTGQERSSQFAGALDSRSVLEQSFTSTRDGLTAIEVFALVPPGRLGAGDTLTLRLREVGAEEDLAVWRLPLQQAQRQRRLVFSFPGQPHSRGRAYRLRIETTASADTITMLASDEDVYPAGELRISGDPVTRDLTFRTYTAITPRMLWVVARSALPDTGRLLVLTAFFCLAGGAFLALLDWRPGETWSEWVLWSAGAGLAITPLAYLLIGRYAGWLLAALAGMALLRLLWLSLYRHPLALPRLTAADGLLLLLFLWALVVRCMQIQDVPVPMWVDGLRHWQMAQTIVEAGRIPSGLLYHVGYHTHAALLHWYTGWDLPRLLLLLGQWISAMNGPALFVLALPVFTHCGLKRPRLAALAAAAMLTCLPNLPGYLMNWGRYPFLLGLTLLPFFLAALTFTMQVGATPARANWKALALLLLLLGGMTLSHYGMLSFALSFAAILLALCPPEWLRGLRPARGIGAALLLTLLGGGFLALRFGDNLLPRLGELVAQSRAAQDDLRAQEIVQILLRRGGSWLALTGSLGAVWAYLRARPLLWLSVGWFAVQAALTALQAPLMGYGLASYTNLLLALSLPLALLAGGFLLDRLPAPGSRKHAVIQLCAAVIVCTAGGIAQIRILNPAALTFSPADAEAIEWIRANTAPGARFLVNSAPWGGQVIPSDGGGWITPLAARPSVFAGALQPPDWEDLIRTECVDYIFLGRHAGFLTRAEAASIPGLRLVYDRQGIQVFFVTR